MRTPDLTVTIKDCKVDTFRAGGPGGQNQNKRESAVRITHPPSGAVGESRERKEQRQNKKLAFSRMAGSKKFLAWAKAQVLRTRPVAEIVAEEMRPENLRVEAWNDNAWEIVE